VSSSSSGPPDNLSPPFAAGSDPPATQEPIVVDPTTNQELGPMSVVMQELWFSGPLPAPQMLEGYDRVLPGLAGRIVERWERESDHRQHIEKAVVRSRISIQSRGQIIGAIISVIVLAAGIVFVATGRDTTGLVAILAPLAVLVGAFVYGEVKSRAERAREDS